MPAKSEDEMLEETARSGLPTSLKKTVSPVKMANYFPVSLARTKDVL